MAEVAGVAFDDNVDVVPVDREVVEVCEQPDVVRAGLLPNTGDDAEGVVGGEERVAGRAAERFEQHGSADPGHGAGGGCEVLDCQCVLGFGVYPSCRLP